MVCIIILNWNGAALTIDCVKSLLNINYLNIKILIIDNGSKDKSMEKFKIAFDDISMIEILSLPNNIGFTGGNNFGIEYAKKKHNPDYYLLLNNDTIVDKMFLTNMIDSIQSNQNIYAVVPKIYYHSPSNIIWFAGGEVSKLTGIAKHWGINKVDSFKNNIPKFINYMNGCCVLIRKESIIEVGILDDIFFANSEDVDYGFRILKHNKKIYYQPKAFIYHKVHYSFEFNKGSWFTYYLATRNIILLQKKHMPYLLLPYFFCVFLLKWILYLTVKLYFTNNNLAIKGLYKGLYDGIFNKISYVE